MLQAMRSSDITPLVRVPWLDPAAIMKALDAGAYGVICPMINNARGGGACVLRPLSAPWRAELRSNTGQFLGRRRLWSDADAEILCFAMIETADAVANLDDIVSTPGLDGVYIGPADLTLGLTGKRYPSGLTVRSPRSSRPFRPFSQGRIRPESAPRSIVVSRPMRRRRSAGASILSRFPTMSGFLQAPRAPASPMHAGSSLLKDKGGRPFRRPGGRWACDWRRRARLRPDFEPAASGMFVR